ncbi:MAG: hypothetical protein V4726_12160 [Verrucomicrobiota bacterium]
MPFFPVFIHPEDNRAPVQREPVLQGLKRAGAAWVIGLLGSALLWGIFFSGKFPLSVHAAITAGPVLFVLPKSSELGDDAMTVFFYGLSFLVTAGFHLVRYSWLWLILWLITGSIAMFSRLVYAFST